MTAFAVQTPNSLAEEVANAVGRYGMPLYSLFTTYTFNPTWFAKEILPLVSRDTVRDELATGLLVVCDRQHYRGHSGGPWVKTWPGQELFHPKVALLVFDKATVLFAGSANLTRRGHNDQIELMAMETWERQGLPAAMKPICSRIGGMLAQELLRLPIIPSRRFVCSLTGPFENRLTKSRADELTVVSPFYDRQESAEAPDLSFIDALAERLHPTTITVVAPVLETGHVPARVKQTVQLPSAFVRRWKRQLVLYGVNPDDRSGRALHAKVLAVRRGKRLEILVGSANATCAGMRGANVEAGWFACMEQATFRTWLKKGGLLDNRLDPTKIRCVLPRVQLRDDGCPVASAILDEATEVLTVSWRRQASSAVSLSYEGRKLRAAGNRIAGFRINNAWYLTVKSRNAVRAWQVPIEVDGEIPGPRTGLTYSVDDPDAMLGSLTGLPDLGEDEGAVARATGGKGGTVDEPTSLRLYERIRRLTDFTAAARGALSGDSRSRLLATLSLLIRTARAHDPFASGIDDSERSWRYWVRAEVFRTMRHAPDSRERRRARKAVRRLLVIGRASGPLRKSLQAIHKELVG